jgi:branched-chain amino acid transport system substrate-binding protein
MEMTENHQNIFATLFIYGACRLRAIKSSLLLAFSLTLIFSLQAFTALAAKPIVFGVSLGLTGKFAPVSLDMQNGIRLWEKQVNKKGGILGRPVKVLIEDDQSSPEKTKNIYQSYIDSGRVNFYIGPYSSAITAAAISVVEKANIPMVATAAASSSLWQKGYKNLLGLLAVAPQYSLGFLEIAAIHGHTRFAIISDNSPFGRSIAEGARRWTKDFGLNVVVNEEFKKGRRNLTEFARKAADAKVTALIATGHYDEAVDMRRALEAIGYNDIAYFSAVGPAVPKYLKDLGPLAEKSFSTAWWSPKVEHQRGDFDLFLNPYLKTYHKVPDHNVALIYAAGQVYEAAITHANSVDPDKVRQALYQLDILTIIGRYGVNPSGQQSKQFLLTNQWQNGKIEVVGPEKLASKKPIIKTVN